MDNTSNTNIDSRVEFSDTKLKLSRRISEIIEESEISSNSLHPNGLSQKQFFDQNTSKFREIVKNRNKPNDLLNTSYTQPSESEIDVYEADKLPSKHFLMRSEAKIFPEQEKPSTKIKGQKNVQNLFSRQICGCTIS